ncbi:MAG: GDP-fucose synthetase [Sphingopyxis sp.]|nr:MAG: GDP-fucose synthetase [Sphingopyxis sp.]
MHYELEGQKIWVAGSQGMVGSAVVRRLEREGCKILVTTRAELDLSDQSAVFDWLNLKRPDAIVLAAAKVGGILANNDHPAEFLHDNLVIETNIIHGAHITGVDRLLFLGSSCIYPKLAKQPIVEEALLTGALEPTNEWYAIAKIAGIKMCEAYRRQYGRDYISAMPTNLYGPGDNFDLKSSHVLPALIRKAHEAKLAGAESLTIWGTGSPMREFLHVDDCADALVFLLKTYSDDMHINVGSGSDLSIYDLTRLVCSAVGFVGNIEKDETKPDGTPRKLMSAERLRALGWSPQISLEDGIHSTYQWYLDNAR